MWKYPEVRSCWRRLIASGVALWLGLAQALPAQTQAKKYAILVGINDYQHARLPALSYAVNDVTGLSQVLEKAGYEVSLLCDTTGKKDRQLAPIKVNIEKHLKTTLHKCRKGDTVFMAFAGHGLQFEGQKGSFFCPSDARPFADRTESLVSLGEIYEELDASFAAVKIMLVDACRNDPRGGRGTRGVDADSAPRPPRGVAALFSCSAGQTAYEDERLKHGVFFHFVLQGLQGEAKDSDGEVTFDSLSSYVRKQVAREVPKMYGKDSQQSPNLKADLSGESPVLVRDDLQKVIDKAIKAHGSDKGQKVSVDLRDRVNRDEAGSFTSDAIQKADEEIWKDVATNQTPVDADNVLVINGSTDLRDRAGRVRSGHEGLPQVRRRNQGGRGREGHGAQKR
jgi:hypothetical protein